MKKAVIYVHGKGGSAAEAEHYKPLFPDGDVFGIDYRADTPWAAKEEFPALIAPIAEAYGAVILIANSIGAFFSMHALAGAKIEKAYFISPIVDMEGLILGLMRASGVSEETLRAKGKIKASSGEILDDAYLAYVRANPLLWTAPTAVLYGENDCLQSRESVAAFADRIGASLTVMPGGEHWFHTEAQMRFLDQWIVGM